MSASAPQLVPDEVFYRIDDEIALFTALMRGFGDDDPRSARDCRRQVELLKLALEGGPGSDAELKPIRGIPRSPEQAAREFAVPVDEFDPKKDLRGVWGDLDSATRELLKAARKSVYATPDRKIGYAAAGVAATIQAAMERELWIRTSEARAHFKKADPLPWRGTDRGGPGTARFDGRWTCRDLISLADHWLTAQGKDPHPLWHANLVRKLRNRIHQMGDEYPLTPDELNQLLYHAGLGPRGRRPTLWHALRDLQPSRPGEPGAVATAS
jgi:hypothetical protein